MKFLLLILMLLTGCSYTPLSNDQIIAEAHKCKSGGLDYQLLRSGWTMDVVAVQCVRPCGVK